MQTNNPFFDDLAKLANSAAGVAQGMTEEARNFFHSQFERFVADMDLVRRDEYDIALARIAALEEKLDALMAQGAQTKAKSTKNSDNK